MAARPGSSGHFGGPLALWVTPVAEIGGVGRHVLDATRHGIDPWRIVVACPDGPLADRLARQGTTVFRAPISPKDGPLRALRTLRRIVARLRPDLLHTHLAFADFLGVVAVAGLRSRRGARIRVVSTEHGISGVRGLYQPSRARAHVMAGAHRARLLRTDRVIAVSESTREQVAVQWGGARRTVVVRNGVEPVTLTVDVASVSTAEVAAPADAGGDAESATCQPALRVLTLSRLAPEKRIDAVLRAMPHVLAQCPDARLTIAGTGEQDEALRALAARLGIEASLDMPGFKDPDAAMAEHDVVVQLSSWENLSYTLLDAAARGMGVVATDVGGNREIVPAQCLVDADDAAQVARTIMLQAMRPEDRPRPGTLPGADQMCTGIVAVYRGVMP